MFFRAQNLLLAVLAAGCLWTVLAMTILGEPVDFVSDLFEDIVQLGARLRVGRDRAFVRSGGLFVVALEVQDVGRGA